MAIYDMDMDFTGGNAEASLTYPLSAGRIKKGSFMLIQGNPCKVLSISTCSSGKHGHSKSHFVGVDVFTDKKMEDIVPTTHNVYVPIVTRTDYVLLNISDEDYCTLLADDGTLQENIKVPAVPTDLGKRIKASFEADKHLVVSVMSAMKQERIIAVQEVRDSN
eukprot:CAMPEP_0185037170 /NCGR_PEP_ID=MMETSP1103-20130426/31193_1 /TAXON_ID=36769 /ORGANISM="Paraphysomonas bandaiensis, Strain Caron Lab Isolate" /LENGTH=162 /DNA_ID=CAMNT_0027575019 /DNA_START=91 /DNA_END=579 /DNA_ORIENTATION=-